MAKVMISYGTVRAIEGLPIPIRSMLLYTSALQQASLSPRIYSNSGTNSHTQLPTIPEFETPVELNGDRWPYRAVARMSAG